MSRKEEDGQKKRKSERNGGREVGGKVEGKQGMRGKSRGGKESQESLDRGAGAIGCLRCYLGLLILILLGRRQFLFPHKLKSYRHLEANSNRIIEAHR